MGSLYGVKMHSVRFGEHLSFPRPLQPGGTGSFLWICSLESGKMITYTTWLRRALVRGLQNYPKFLKSENRIVSVACLAIA